MPYEIQSKLRFNKAVLKDMPGDWRVEFVDMNLDPSKALYITMNFSDVNCDKEKAEKLVAGVLEALNKL